MIEAVYDTVHTYYGEPTDAGVPYDDGFIVPAIDIVEVLGERVSTGMQISSRPLSMPKRMVMISYPWPTDTGQGAIRMKFSHRPGVYLVIP